MAIAKLHSSVITGATFETTGAVVDTVVDIGTGSDLFMIVSVSWGANNGHTMQNAPTWNGVSMTELGAQTTQGTTNRKHSYYLANPATGSNTLRIDPSTGSAQTTEVVIEVYVYSGVDVSGTPFDGYNTSTGTDGSAPFDSTLTITSASGDKVWVSHSIRSQGGNPSAASPTNFTEQHETLDGAYGVESGDADGDTSVATTATFTCTGAFAFSFNAHGVNLNAAAGGGGDVGPGGYYNYYKRTILGVAA
jgi:hypothetical protein